MGFWTFLWDRICKEAWPINLVGWALFFCLGSVTGFIGLSSRNISLMKCGTGNTESGFLHLLHTHHPFMRLQNMPWETRECALLRDLSGTHRRGYGGDEGPVKGLNGQFPGFARLKPLLRPKPEYPLLMTLGNTKSGSSFLGRIRSENFSWIPFQV